MYLRQANRKIIDMFRSLTETLILITQTKDKMINFEGTEINEIAIDLAGKIGDILCGEADAIGYVYRKKNETIISFEGGEGTVREARVCKSNSNFGTCGGCKITAGFYNFKVIFIIKIINY